MKEIIKEHKKLRKPENKKYSREKEIKKARFFFTVNKPCFISLFHRKETEHVVIKTAGKVTSYRYASKDLLD